MPMKLQVICPAGTTTGGPEAMHQLVHTARSQGLDARMVYLPPAPQGESPIAKPYRVYDIAFEEHIDDAPDTLIIVPEVDTWRLRRVKRAKKAIWWLSIDNYFRSVAQAKRKRLKHWLGLNRPFDLSHPDPQVWHLAQSEYARQYLERFGLSRILMLTDYLRDDFIQTIGAQTHDAPARRPRVAFNPKKGIEFTQRLMQRAGNQLEFVRLEGMTPKEVLETLQSSAVYMDFGEHPGRDRIPREAAMCGCCVITGRRGSATNGIDIPIPAHFKIDETAENFESQALPLLERLTRDHHQETAAFTNYRQTILKQKSVFEQEVCALFQSISQTPP